MNPIQYKTAMLYTFGVQHGWYGVKVSTRLREVFNLSTKDSLITFIEGGKYNEKFSQGR